MITPLNIELKISHIMLSHHNLGKKVIPILFSLRLGHLASVDWMTIMQYAHQLIYSKITYSQL